MPQRLRRTFAFIFVFASIATSVHAQDYIRLGVTGGYNRNWHHAALPLLTAEPECGNYTYGTGNGMYLGLAGEVPVLTWLRGSARLTWSQLGGSLQTHCSLIEVTDPATGAIVPLVREYTRTAAIDYLQLELGGNIAPFDFPLYGSAGVGFGIPTAASNDEHERIISPSGVRYPDGTIKRKNYEGDIASPSTRLALYAGLGYDYFLKPNLILAPEIAFHYPLTDVASGLDWNIQSMRAGISLQWLIDLREPEAPPPPPPPPPPQVRKPVAHIGAATGASVDITETYVTETFPLLPYVFFEKGTARMIPRYVQLDKEATQAFTETGLPRKNLLIYYQLLDIVGYRMRRNPSANITLIGATDNKGTEEGNDSLARARASEVKRYLTSVWSIAPERIAIKSQKLPPIPTSQTYVEGDEENRRVDIVSNDESLFRPVVHERFSEFDINPPELALSLGSEAVDGIERWDVSISFSGGVAKEFHGAGSPPDSLRWLLSEDLAVGVQSEDALRATLTVYDRNGESSSSEVAIPVSKKQNAFEVGRLSLIVFDFDRADIRGQNKAMIEKFVATAIKPTSTASITGSTDILGEEEHNKELSAARAESVKNIILGQNPGIRNLEARGIGEAPDLYDNTLPEGRFYCRTVSVEVKTPLVK